jgi:hypothetical protein
MTDSEREPDPNSPDDPGASQAKEPPPFWRRTAFAVAAALIALIGMVWRCA